MRVILVGLLASFGLLGAPLVAPADAATSTAPWGYSSPAATTTRHPMPFAPTAQSAPANSHLDYLGGPVISNVAVQSVYWGTGGSLGYQDGVRTPLVPCPATTPCTMDEYFQGVTDSAHLDWLSEYDTASQSIGRGVFRGRNTISVSSVNSGATISEQQVGAELVHQVESGALPRPEVDAGGEVKTLYATFFPRSITLTLGGSVGGEVGGFCAYHSTAQLDDGTPLPFMVLPDFRSHRFDEGCGSSASLFDNFLSVTSHELVEAITDPLVGLGVPSWIDGGTGLEIADICQTVDPDQAVVTGGNGLSLVVQKEFSNVANDCVGVRNAPTLARTGYVDACEIAGRTGFADAGFAADCLKRYGISQGKADGTFGENDGLVRSQVSSLLTRLIEMSGITLVARKSFPDVAVLSDTQVRDEIESLAGAGIITGFPDGQFRPSADLSVAQAVALVTRTLEFIHAANPQTPAVVSGETTAADYLAAVDVGLLDLSATNGRGFAYSSGVADGTDRGLLADVLAQAIQRLVDADPSFRR